jgi:hypothetical protein
MSVDILNILHECNYELNDFQNKKLITPTQYIYAIQVIEGLEKVYLHQDIISKIINENKRNEYITKLTNLIAETGLFPGETTEGVLKSIDIRIDVFIHTYLSDKINHDTLSFFQKAFVGPPCFNGRLITLEHYTLTKHQLKSPLFYEYQTQWDKEAVVLEEFMHNYFAELNIESDHPPSLEQLTEYSKDMKKNDLQTLLLSDSINCIYQRACQFFTGA